MSETDVETTRRYTGASADRDGCREVGVAEFSSHNPGTFCWVELATTDQKAAVAFYRALFGWDVNEQAIGPNEIYTMFLMRGKEVAAASTQQPQERQSGAPPHWNLFITVANTNEAVTRAQALGAKVLAPAFDVMDAGRMAVVQDPTGAVFSVWEPKKHIGVKILNEPGALCWSELTTRDTRAAEAFYTQFFGWTAKHSAPSAVDDYTEFSNQGQGGIGMMAMRPDMPAGTPSYWMPYFQVADCDVSTAKATKLGARVMVPPTDIPKTGRFSIVGDPQGAMLALFTFAGA
jgi:predicted enzyme related to lactoylglutathione lyase